MVGSDDDAIAFSASIDSSIVVSVDILIKSSKEMEMNAQMVSNLRIRIIVVKIKQHPTGCQ